MFGNPGVAYVYFIYGMYEMLNFVTEPKGYPGAVLIRAVEPVLGEELMTRRRSSGKIKKIARDQLTNGPGRLSQAMGIKMSHKGQSLWGPAIFVADDGFRPASIFCSPRVGISLGSDLLWRYFISGNPFVSKVPQNQLARPVIASRRGSA
jgi:DNA-3-methyladenine glycosylase